MYHSGKPLTRKREVCYCALFPRGRGLHRIPRKLAPTTVHALVLSGKAGRWYQYNIRNAEQTGNAPC